MSSATVRLISPAWLLVDVASRAGVLALESGRLSFTTTGREVVFDEPLGAVTDVAFPWYWFSGGFRARVAGTRRRVSFLPPADLGDGGGSPFDLLDVLVPGSDAAGAAAGAAFAPAEIARGRAAGKAWRAVLTGVAS